MTRSFVPSVRFAAGIVSIVALLLVSALSVQLALGAQENLTIAKEASDDLVDPGQAFTFT